MIVKPGQFAPDLATFQNPGSPSVLNALPLSGADYGPWPSLADYSTNALNNPCQGAVAYQDNLGNALVFAGDSSNLYLMTSATEPVFDIVSKAGGYTAQAQGFWKWTQYGNYVITTDYQDNIQAYILGTSSAFADLASGANATITVTLGGTVTVGDAITLTITNSIELSTSYTATATAASGNTLTTLATELATSINTNANLSSVGISATSSGDVVTVLQAGQVGNQTQVAAAITGSKTETFTLSNSSGYLAGGVDIAPRAKYCAIIRNFLMLGNTYDAVNGEKLQRIWWSGLGDPTSWPTPDTNWANEVQSDFQDIFGDYGQITGVFGDLGTADGAVFMQRGVIRLTYAGAPDIFDVLPAEGVRGSSAPGSIVQVGAMLYYRADDGFYVFDGTFSTQIGFGKVDEWFSQVVDPQYVNNMVGVADPTNKIVYWSFSGLGNNGVRNMTLAYNWQSGQFAPANFGVQAFVRALSFATTIDQMGVLDNTIAPFDSPIYAGGRLQLAAFDTNNNRMGYFTGPALAAQIDTAETQIFDGARALVTNARPLVDGGAPTVSIGYRNRLSDPVTWGPAVAMDAIGNAWQRCDAFYHRARIAQPAGETWQHMIGVDFTATRTGVR